MFSSAMKFNQGDGTQNDRGAIPNANLLHECPRSPFDAAFAPTAEIRLIITQVMMQPLRETFSKTPSSYARVRRERKKERYKEEGKGEEEKKKKRKKKDTARAERQSRGRYCRHHLNTRATRWHLCVPCPKPLLCFFFHCYEEVCA
jgi:hypothetical protein